MSQVYVEISGCPRAKNRIDVDFKYDKHLVAAIRGVEGRRFQSRKKGATHDHWHVPLDLETCRTLRQQYGDALVIGPNLRAWAAAAVRDESQLGSIALAESADLKLLPTLLPSLHAAMVTRPYQLAGVAFLAHAKNPLVADQPGLGKTLETIGAIFEGGTHEGSHLVVAPLVSLETVWQYEIERWGAGEAYVPMGTRAEREATIAAFHASTAKTKWLIINPAMVQYRKDKTNQGPIVIKAKPKDFVEACHCDRMKDAHWHYTEPYDINAHTWRTLIVDEAHKGAVRNPTTLTAKALYAVRSDKRIAVTGTPMTKNSLDLWGVLHFLNPEAFTSKWTWAERYCIIEDNGYGKTIKGFRDDRKEALYRSLTPYVLRRTKAEVLKELPPKQFIDVWVELEGEQAKQYKAMEADGVARLSDTDLETLGVLDEFLRLKQFAIAKCEFRDGKVVPTATSAKLDALLQLLEERGIFDGGIPEDQQEKVVVFSQFEEVVSLVCAALRERDVAHARITGKENKRGQRTAIQKAFQADGGPQVLVMTTTAGGVAITLDRADTVVFMDETWSYADAEQAEDRVHRASRMHQVFIYNIRAKDTVDEYVMETVDEKEHLHVDVMDTRRKFLANRIDKYKEQ